MKDVGTEVELEGVSTEAELEDVGTEAELEDVCVKTTSNLFLQTALWVKDWIPKGQQSLDMRAISSNL